MFSFHPSWKIFLLIIPTHLISQIKNKLLFAAFFLSKRYFFAAAYKKVKHSDITELLNAEEDSGGRRTIYRKIRNVQYFCYRSYALKAWTRLEAFGIYWIKVWMVRNDRKKTNNKKHKAPAWEKELGNSVGDNKLTFKSEG